MRSPTPCSATSARIARPAPTPWASSASGSPAPSFRTVGKSIERLSIELGLRWEWLQPWYTDANNMANFVPALYDPSQAVTINSAGRVVPGSGNLYNGLIRAGMASPPTSRAACRAAQTPFFTQIPAGAPRGFFQPQNTWSPRFGFAYP